MELIFSDNAKKQLEKLSHDMKLIFLKRLEKIQRTPPRKHMRYGIPCHVENVTKQARLIYFMEDKKIYILQCFKNHKEYELWYKSYK